MSDTLLEFFDRRRDSGEPLVLATVVDTEGSTYSKSGERMLVDRDGIYRGLLSGGCLEGDLAIRAAQTIESGVNAIVEYDFRDEDDEIFGLGAGCLGCLRILLQPLGPANHYEPFASIAAVLRSDTSAVLVTALEETAGVSIGDAALIRDDGEHSLGWTVTAGCRDIAASVADVRRSAVRSVAVGGSRIAVHFAYLEPPPRFLVLGAGPDAQPVLDIAGTLGWRCTVYDHRPAYIAALTGPAEKLCAAAEALPDRVPLAAFDRAIIMSHHLATDRTYLRHLAETDMNYIGLLGPPSRKQRLFEDLGDDAHRLEHRVRGPAGLNFGARGPAVIALSIIAEIQQLLH